MKLQHIFVLKYERERSLEGQLCSYYSLPSYVPDRDFMNHRLHRSLPWPHSYVSTPFLYTRLTLQHPASHVLAVSLD
jgi:hypothetical protein